MEITAITGTIGLQARGALQSAERMNPHIPKSRETYGDNRLHVDAPGERAGALNKVSAKDYNLGDQQELFSALLSKLEERSNATIEISININVIKANLGSLLATVLNQPAPDILSGSLAKTVSSSEADQIDSSVRERYINSLITVGIDDGGIFSGANGLLTTTDGFDSITPLPSTQMDGRQLLLNLLIGDLGTPPDDATAIVNTLQSQPFQTVA